MKKILNTCLLLTFLFSYLEWGKDNHTFIFQGEAEVFLQAKNNPGVILHPAILIPLLGQILLLYTLFQQKPGRVLTLTGLACLSTIILMLIVAGINTFNTRILVSLIPFIITAIFVLRYNRKQRT